MEELVKVLTDPVSNKILQLIRMNAEMTIADILAANIGIPRATIYRKMEKMEKVGAVYVSSTNKIRGQIEKVYRIKDIYIASKGDHKEDMRNVTVSLMGLIEQYETYFRKENADVAKDKLFLFNYNISLDDEDFSAMLKEIYQIVDKYQNKQGTGDEKLRNLYMISAPGGEV